MIYAEIKCKGCGSLRGMADVAVSAFQLNEFVRVDKECPGCRAIEGKLLKLIVSSHPHPEMQDCFYVTFGVPPTLPEVKFTPESVRSAMADILAQVNDDIINSMRLPVPELELDDDDQIVLLKRMYEKEL